MNTVQLLNQTVKCGKPNQKKQIEFCVVEESIKSVSVVLQDCSHPDQRVVDKFNQSFKGQNLVAKSMNNLKDQLFDILEIENHAGHWMDTMRIDGVTIRKMCRVEDPTTKPMLLPNQKPYYVYLIEGNDFAYVGLTTNFNDRQSSHKRACMDNLNKNFKGFKPDTSFGSFKTYNSAQQVYTAINNNGGWDKVKMNIVETVFTDDQSVARDRETAWINKITIEHPNIAVLNATVLNKPFVKCSEPCCESKTRRVCATCNISSACKKHSVCLSCKDIEAWKKKECEGSIKDTEAANRERARNAYRIKKGIPLDAPLIQRGGARNVKYHTQEQKEERQTMDREYQREYQKKYREKKLQEKNMMMEIVEELHRNIQSPVYMMSFLLESLKNKKTGKSYSDVE